MGAINGCFIPHHYHDEPKENRSPKRSKFKSHRRNLSATFNLSAIEDDTEAQSFVNINSANEEELMTLPGISRAIAKSIIDYRRQIGGFRRVEDLALVSGVGADKLSRLRCDISIGNRNAPGSRDSSLRGSRVDGESVKEKNGRGCTSVVNVNTANLFQLIKVNGVGMNLAENIVTYREKNGPFKSLDDLSKVKGINAGMLSAIRPFLNVESTPENPSPSSPVYPDTKYSVSVQNGMIATAGGDTGAVLPSSALSQNQFKQQSPTSKENLCIYGPLGIIPERLQVSKPFDFRHRNRRVVRVASWNLEQCSLDKVSNPGVKDVICMTILEHGFGIVAIQELSHDKALEEICQELNEPTLPNVKQWAGHRGKWSCAVSQVAGRMFKKTSFRADLLEKSRREQKPPIMHLSVEYNGFLYDTSQKIELVSAGLLEKTEESRKRPFARIPFIGFFRINGQLDYVVVSVHLNATGLKGEDLPHPKAEIATISDVLNSLSSYVPREKDIILVGDFNFSPESNEFDKLRQKRYTNVIKVDCIPNTSSSNPEGSKCCDNLWISQQTQKMHTGNKGVVREGLTSPWIPNGWKWGGAVSDHCPMYAEFYTSKDLEKGDLPIGTDGVRFIIGADSG